MENKSEETRRGGEDDAAAVGWREHVIESDGSMYYASVANGTVVRMAERAVCRN